MNVAQLNQCPTRPQSHSHQVRPSCIVASRVPCLEGAGKVDYRAGQKP